MLKKILSFLMCISLFTTSIFAMLVIDEPGQYQLGDNLFVTGEDNILIAVSDVQLDLQQFVVSGGTNGVVIPEGLSNIIVFNGYIADIEGAGISLGGGCDSIVFKDLTLAYCQTRGIELLGSSTGNITSVVCENIVTYSCLHGSAADFAFYANYSQLLSLINCQFAGNGNPVNPISIINLNNSQECLLLGINCLGNTGKSLTNITLNNINSSLFRNFFQINNSAQETNEIFTGFLLTGSSNYNGFGPALLLTNSSLQGDCIGVSLDEGCCNNVFENCQIGSNYGKSNYGFVIEGSGTPSVTNNNILTRCEIGNNVAFGLTSTSAGIAIRRADSCAIDLTRIAFNSAPNGTSVGILFEDGTGGDQWLVRNCALINNIGTSDTDSYGIFIQTGTNNFFVQNYASGNGNIATNQFSGIPSGSQTQVTINTINNATAPFTNLAVTI